MNTTTQQNEWEAKVIKNIENKVGIFIPRGSISMTKAKYINRKYLIDMVKKEGYGQ